MTLRWTKFISNDYQGPLYAPHPDLNPMPSKDQQSIEPSSAYESWDRAKTLLLESLHKPDNALRSCAHNQHCYDDLMLIRDEVIQHVQNMSNPRPLVEPDPKAPKSYEYAAHITLSDIARFQRGHSL